MADERAAVVFGLTRGFIFRQWSPSVLSVVVGCRP